MKHKIVDTTSVLFIEDISFIAHLLFLQVESEIYKGQRAEILV
jgi:hypothetical protein